MYDIYIFYLVNFFFGSCICELDDYCNERGIQVVPVLDVSPQIQFEDLDDLYSTLQDFIANFQNAQ